MIDKFQASLLGYAIGDALAAPIEDVTRATEEGENLISFYVKAFPSHPVHHLEPGQYSDETQMMLILARSLVEKGEFVVEDVISKFVDWLGNQKKRSEWRFPGNTTLKACQKLAAGAVHTQSGFMSAGIHGSCRIVPYALAYFRSPSLLNNSIEVSCRLSHTDPRAIGVAKALATVIALGIEGSEFTPDYVMNRVIEKSQSLVPEMVKKMRIVKDCLRNPKLDPIALIGNTAFCIEAFPLALFYFLKSEARFDEMIVASANTGGDSDAVAAMAGAMFGAWFGLGAIPERWIEPLEDYQLIRQLGSDIYRLATSK